LIVSLIVALDLQGGIGRAGKLPWRLASDLRRFKALTLQHHLVMGRKTYQAIGRPLPGRVNIVVSRTAGAQFAGCLAAGDLAQALEIARRAGEQEVFVIGGGQIFAQALAAARRIYLTRVQAVTDCDTFFPSFEPGDWQVLEKQELPAGEQDEYATSFEVLERRAI
jgi:dihydrofolate reductase